jgi:DNA-binding transcriptional ArsR family regulator
MRRDGSMRLRKLEALADPHRLALVELLLKKPRSVRELADHFSISRPAVSKHLKLLKQAELVADELRGAKRIYSVRAEGLAEVREYLERLWTEATQRYKIVAENTRSRKA